MGKLSTKEREEVVTKGYLEDQDYVTKGYLESKEYITKSYFDSYMQDFREEFQRYVGALSEDFKHHIQMMIESMEIRANAENAKSASRMSASEIWLSNHEDRIGKLETSK